MIVSGFLMALIGYGIVANALVVFILSISTTNILIQIILVILETAYVILALLRLIRLAYLIFSKSSPGHSQLSFWNILDLYLGYLLANVLITYAIWHIALCTGNTDQFSVTGDVSAGTAYFQLFVYTIMMACGGGLGLNLPVSDIAQLWTALIMPAVTIVLVIIIAGLVATVLDHVNQVIEARHHPPKEKNSVLFQPKNMNTVK